MFVKILFFIIISCFACYLFLNKSYAAENYIYFDLAAGDVKITATTYTGYVYKITNGTATVQTISGTHSTSNKYYIYQSNDSNKLTTGLQSDNTYILPTYNRIQYNGKSWGNYITNNTDVLEVISAWNTAANNVGRTETPAVTKLNDNITSGNADVNVPMHHRIIIESDSAVTTNFNVTIDNVWSGFQNDDCKDANGNIYEGTYINDGSHYRTSGGLTFRPQNLTTTATIYIKGDNRFGNIHYDVESGSSALEGSGRIEQLYFENRDSEENPGTLTVANLGGDTAYNHFCSVIGGANKPNYVPGIVINSGVIYAGATERDNCTAIGGGGCGFGGVTIKGGKVTAITAGNGAAIGGGIGDGSNGGAADVYISGGEVYAYNIGLAIEGTRESTSGLKGLETAGYLVPGTEGDAKVCHVVMPSVAIGSGSSRRGTTLPATITITGGNVFAQSVGGTAIGGGSSVNFDAADATINITGGVITAKSVPGNVNVIHEYDSGKFPTYVDSKEYVIASASIGGGTAGVPFRYLRKNTFGSGTNEPVKDANGNYQLIPYGSGGNAILNISGNSTIIKAGSIGGGGTSDPKSDGTATGKIGSAQVEINDGTIQGQIIMAAGADMASQFIMTGGIIDNNEKSRSSDFYFLKENGGAVFLESGSVTITGGTIQNCEAINGGAIYVTGGDFNISGTGKIKNCIATNGGAVYVSNGNILMNGGEISNNQAKQYGGGIYASSNDNDLTVSITSGSIIGNIASLNGGGVGVNMGNGLSATVTVGLETCEGLDESHRHPIIQDNTANENGGGFWLNGDKMVMNMYCGYIKENLAILEPGSANIYQTGGTATVHSGEVGEGVIVIGGEYVYIPENQLNEITITYNSNIPNNSETQTALITVGVEIYLPKNLFTRDGYVLAGWSHIPNPTQNDKIYTVGEPYLVGNENITVYAIWLLEGSGTVVTPGIENGECFDEVTNGTNIIMTSNASFTTQMSVHDIQPNYYMNRTLKFDKIIPNGTNITMVDLTNPNQKMFYYYKVIKNETQIIRLSEFIKNGTNENYVDSTSSERVNENFLFVVELPKDNEETGARTITLVRNSADSEVAAIEQTTTYTMTKKREFKLSYDDGTGILEEPTIENTLKIYYEKTTPLGDDTRYQNKKVSLIITETNGKDIPEETKLFDGTNYYIQNGSNRFIIPLGDVDEDKEINLQLISKSLKENELGYNLKIELVVANDENTPGMGEVVAEIESIELNAISLPAMQLNLNQYAYNQNEFTGNLELNYESIKLDEKTVTLEVQKKLNDGSYETQTEVLETVEGNSENIDGVFNLELGDSGSIDLDFIDSFKTQTGTYRILLKVSDISNTVWEIPCNFIVVK